MLLDVKSYVNQEKQKIKEKGDARTLVIVQIGDDRASNSYVKGKMRDCAEVGDKAALLKFSEDADIELVKNCMRAAMARDIDGIIVQYPCPHFEELAGMIPSGIDVDGLTRESYFEPCTPLGIVNYLKSMMSLQGKVVTVVGKGRLVGGPLVPRLMREGATVVSCNSKTQRVDAMTFMADIVVSATGVRGLIKKDMIKKGAIVVDAGITFDEEGNMCGDCDVDMYDPNDGGFAVTTVPGGVGLLTRVSLLENLHKREKKREIETVEMAEVENVELKV